MNEAASQSFLLLVLHFANEDPQVELKAFSVSAKRHKLRFEVTLLAVCGKKGPPDHLDPINAFTQGPYHLLGPVQLVFKR